MAYYVCASLSLGYDFNSDYSTYRTREPEKKRDIDAGLDDYLFNSLFDNLPHRLKQWSGYNVEVPYDNIPFMRYGEMRDHLNDELGKLELYDSTKYVKAVLGDTSAASSRYMYIGIEDDPEHRVLNVEEIFLRTEFGEIEECRLVFKDSSNRIWRPRLYASLSWSLRGTGTCENSFLPPFMPEI